MPERFEGNPISERAPSIEEQFDLPETWELNGETINVIDVWPSKTKTKVPVVIAPGWAATPELFKGNILAMAREERRTICVDAPHGIPAEPVDGFPEAELRKVAALITTLEQKGIEQVDAVAHSEGAINIAIAATLYPEKFRNLVLVDPAGMIGKDTLGRLAIDFSIDVVKRQIERLRAEPSLAKPIARSFIEGGKAVVRNPTRAYEEIRAITQTQIDSLLKGLKEKGIGISIIHGVNDKAFPMRRVQEVAAKKQMHGFYSVQGTHNEFYLKPKEYTRLADQALTALEERKK